MEPTTDAQTFTAVFEPTPGQAPLRLDVFWTNRLAEQDVARARIQEAITAGGAWVNGQVCRKPGSKLRGGEQLRLELPETTCELTAEDAPLRILYRDASLLVLDKPPGLTVHPAPGLPDGTLVNRLLHHCPELRDLAGPRPGIVHRLDKDTSGLLVVALTEAARTALAATFAERGAHKTYLALVHGKPDRAEDVIRTPIGRDPDHPTRMAVVRKGGREALSRYRLVWTAPDARASLLEVTIATGRTHQIRVHLASLGHPVLGDIVYGSRQQAEWKRLPGPVARLAGRQMLHAWKLAFPHPETGETLTFCCPPPRDFWRLLLLLGRRLQRIGLVGMPGCGKSTLLTRFGAAGFPTFSADAVVAELYAPGGGGAHMLSRRFGEAALTAEGAVNKAWLLAAMRDSEKTRREVMDLVHPLVKGRLEAFFQAHAHRRAAFAETPLLLEAGWHKGGDVDVVVGVGCAVAARRGRLAGRGWSEDLMDRMDGWQWDEAKKLGQCRYVVDNSGEPADLAAGADRVLAALAGERRAEAMSRFQALLSAGYAARPGELPPEQTGPPGEPA